MGIFQRKAVLLWLADIIYARKEEATDPKGSCEIQFWVLSANHKLSYATHGFLEHQSGGYNVTLRR